MVETQQTPPQLSAKPLDLLMDVDSWSHMLVLSSGTLFSLFNYHPEFLLPVLLFRVLLYECRTHQIQLGVLRPSRQLTLHIKQQQ